MSSHKKQRALNKKRRLRQIKQKRRSADFLSGETVVIRNPPGMRKMSEVLGEFVKPFWDQIPPTEEAMRELLTVGSLAWNLAMFPPLEREKTIRDSEQALPAEAREDFRAILDPLIQRKLERFADNTRMITSVELTMRPTGPYVEVMSTFPAN